VTTIILARHGETDWNREGRWQGHSNTSLNELGKEQARQLADELDGEVDVVYSSDLARARETAEIIAERLGLEVEVDARLRERSFGSWEGLTHPEVEARDAEALARWRAGEGYGALDAEPHDLFADRMSRFLQDVLERHPGERVLVITHGGSMRVTHALVRGLDYVRDRGAIPAVENCAVAKYAARDGKLAPID
jgi:broad specificity phosphatase PhoE